MILALFSSSKMTRESIDTSSGKEGQRSSGQIVHAQYDGRSKIEQNGIFFMTAMVAGEFGTSASQALYSGRERELGSGGRRAARRRLHRGHLQAFHSLVRPLRSILPSRPLDPQAGARSGRQGWPAPQALHLLTASRPSLTAASTTAHWRGTETQDHPSSPRPIN